MKTNLKKAAVLGCLMIASVAHAQSVAQTTNEINAQATITRGAIDNVLARMSEGRPNSQFRAIDYHAQNRDFQARLQAALVKFEDTLTKDIFPKAAFWMDQYNSVFASTEFSAEQKRILLEQRLANLRNQFKTLSVDYNKAITEMYKLVPSADLELKASKDETKAMCRETDTDSVDVFYKANGRLIGKKATFKFTTYDKHDSDRISVDLNGVNLFSDIRGDYTLDNSVDLIDSTECKGGRRVKVGMQVFLEFTAVKSRLNYLREDLYKSLYPSLKGQCRSSICIGLRTGDLVNLLTQISTKLDRNIEMRLSSGETVTLTGKRSDLSLIQSMLARTDYPETLPFDI